MSKEAFYFRDCQKRTHTPITGKVTGKILSWINGTLIRNGAGIRSVGKAKYKHLFDGMAILHKFHIENGKVTYSSRELESETFFKNHAAQKIVVTEFGTLGVGDPCDTLFNKFKSIFISSEKKNGNTSTDNCSVNVSYFGDQLYAMTETPIVRRIDPKTLKSVGGKTDITNYVTIHMASAHPHVLEDGTNITLGMNFRHKNGSTNLVLKIPPSFGSDETNFQNLEVIAEIPNRWRFFPSYSHSFALANDKIVFVEQPFCFQLPKIIMSGLPGGYFRTTIRDALKWYPNEKTRIHVVSIKTGKPHPVIYETDKLFTLHHANAYEEDGNIVFDVCGYDTGEFVSKDLDCKTMDGQQNNNENGCSLRRYVLPLTIKDKNENLVTLQGSGAMATSRDGSRGSIVDVKPDVLLSGWTEFPRYNYKYNGFKYKYIYGCMKVAGSIIPNTIYKIDTETKETKQWSLHEDIWVSEPVFVPNPTIPFPKEDDGVILANILFADDQFKTSLVVLDAKTMRQLGRVDFVPDGPMTTTFHGLWTEAGEK